MAIFSFVKIFLETWMVGKPLPHTQDPGGPRGGPALAARPGTAVVATVAQGRALQVPVPLSRGTSWAGARVGLVLCMLPALGLWSQQGGFCNSD